MRILPVNKAKLTAPFVYVLTTLAVMLPLLIPGYIFALDMVFTPKHALPSEITSSYGLNLLLFIFSKVLPTQIVQKLLLCTILFTSGYGMHKLVQHILKSKQGIYSYYFAGLLYMINPFTYSRFMTGQYQVLLGYALLPVFTLALLRLLKLPSLRSSLYLSAAAVVLAIVSIHTAGMALLITLVAVVLNLIRSKNEMKKIKLLLKWLTVSSAIFVVASSYWLVPLVFGRGGQAQVISSFSVVDQQAFKTEGSGLLGPLLNVVQLKGFWADGRGLYRQAQPLELVQYLSVILILGLVIYGVVVSYKRFKIETITFLIVGVIAIIFATGSIGIFASINRLMNDFIPFFSGYREPQKFVAIITLCYCLFAAVGLDSLLKVLKSSTYSTLLLVLSLVLPAFMAPTMLWGFNGQLRPREYPSEWYSLNQYMHKTIPNEQVLFLPWHQYMSFSFSGRIISNPADRFFDNKIITSTNPEFGNIKSRSSNPVVEKLDSVILPNATNRTDFGEQLKQLDIKYVLLARELDYRTYDYLQSQSTGKVKWQQGTLTLYEF